MPSLWVTAIAIPHALRAVAATGHDPAALAARFGLEADFEYEDRIPIATLVAFMEAAIALTGRRDLSALAPTRDAYDERSLLAFLVANQPRLGDGLALLDRYSPTVSNAYRWRCLIEPGALRLRCAPAGPIHQLGWQVYQEFEVIEVVQTGARLDPRIRPRAVRFLHPRPAPAVADAIGRALGVAPEFASTACELEYPPEVVDVAVPNARPSLSAVVEARLAAILDAATRGEPVTSRARMVVPGLLAAGRADVDALARALHMSRRSLDRALADEGTSAGALIDDERRGLALAWLPALSVDEVAARLGYSDSRAFARAFKRWTGDAPSRVRPRRTPTE